MAAAMLSVSTRTMTAVLPGTRRSDHPIPNHVTKRSSRSEKPCGSRGEEVLPEPILQPQPRPPRRALADAIRSMSSTRSPINATILPCRQPLEHPGDEPRWVGEGSSSVLEDRLESRRHHPNPLKRLLHGLDAEGLRREQPFRPSSPHGGGVAVARGQEALVLQATEE